MWLKIKTLYKAIQSANNSEKLGDFAILKAEVLGAEVEPVVASKLEQVVGYYPKIDLELLSQYSRGTLGREYADHMKANSLKPLNISSELDDVARRNVFSLRYVVTHDIFHVLLGFDTSYAGEIGVLAFAAQQNYSKSLKISLWLARFLYPILAPQQIKAMFANIQKGEEIANQADFLLGYRWEEYWQEPINEIRRRFNLPEISSN
ncbi:Coq4 family protein [Anabaena cylindrica UHCC 0172]|uniref:Coq4 family protein n=1 Tax=Anabaena cylindrica TaxID=1165 RepID=UPI002B213A41|nr:Coq4 family protein [Anabaena cylindrica]MEA5551971.1 Coq4 family protein [Anabaena cylindrica UHCC 0172]